MKFGALIDDNFPMGHTIRETAATQKHSNTSIENKQNESNDQVCHK